MTALTIPAHTAIEFEEPITMRLSGAGLLAVLHSIPENRMADAFEMLPSDKQDQILQSILTDKSIEWMLSEAVRRVTVDKVPTEAATLRALVQCVQAVNDIEDDEDCAAAIAEIRRVVNSETVLRMAVTEAEAERDQLRATLSRVEAERDGLARDLALSRRIEASEDVRGWMYAHGSDGSILLAGEFASGEEFVTKYRTTLTTTEGEKP